MASPASESEREFDVLMVAADLLERWLLRAVAVLFFVAIVIAGVIACLAGDRTSPPAGALRVESYEWHDADTAVNVVVRLPWGVLLSESRGIRDDGFDAWEVGNRNGTSVTNEERERGRLALEELKTISVGRSLWVVPSGRPWQGKRDGFGRLLGRLYLERAGTWIEVAEWAKKNGHARK